MGIIIFGALTIWAGHLYWSTWKKWGKPVIVEDWLALAANTFVVGYIFAGFVYSIIGVL